MLKLKKVAVTGGIGAGKSTACRILKELGAYVISADEIVHHLLHPDSDIGKKIIALLGSQVVINGNFDRKVIAEAVFKDEKLLLGLEAILHPQVNKFIEEEYKKISLSPFPLFVVEIPLLFEGHFEENYDAIILIKADETLEKKRFMQKGHSSLEYEKRNKRLLPIHDKIAKSDFVIENTNDFKDLENKLKQIYSQLTT